MIFIGHLDVVEALPSDWSSDPFKLVEKDGYFYGRGTVDMKDGVTALVIGLIRLKQSGYVPRGDIIVALTDHEEDGGANGAIWLVQNHRDSLDAAYGINPDGGHGESRNGKPSVLQFQTAEKTYVGIDIEVKNPGGHASVPGRDNAIYHLTAGLGRLAAYEFPLTLNETTRTYFARNALLESGQTKADMLALVRQPSDAEAARRLAASNPFYNALLRTTCVATQLQAGHAENALPQTAKATLNARIMPGESARERPAELERVLADPEIKVTRFQVFPSGPLSPLDPAVFDTVEKLAAQRWPGVAVVPTMGTGATDSVHWRLVGIPMYGVSGTFVPSGEHRAHGKDERLGVKEFYDRRRLHVRPHARADGVIPSVAFEVLHSAFVLFRGGAGRERAEVAPPPRCRIELARVEAKTARCEFANHAAILSPSMASRHREMLRFHHQIFGTRIVLIIRLPLIA